jgi:hypothetical protein
MEVDHKSSLPCPQQPAYLRRGISVQQDNGAFSKYIQLSRQRLCEMKMCIMGSSTCWEECSKLFRLSLRSQERKLTVQNKNMTEKTTG